MQTRTEKKLRVVLVGCGQIADAHLQEIQKLDCAEVVAVCDRQIDLAKQAAARFEVPRMFTQLSDALADARPDVVHVTTPPRSHLPLALEALAAGVHVYVEKPFTVNAHEARQILSAAECAGKLVCVGHDQLFDPIWIEARQLCRRGELGEIVHVDSLMGYNLTGPFGKQLSSDQEHWVHSLPGGLFQNNISHALYRITDFLPDSHPWLCADWHGSIASSGQPSELRVMLRGETATGQLIFSSAVRPLARIARIYGTRGSIEVDLDGRVIRRCFAPKLPGAFGKLEVPWRQFCEAAGSLKRNVRSFFRSELQYFAGMQGLFSAFYGAILGGRESPIAYSDVLRVTDIMDRIFESAQSHSRPGRSNYEPIDIVEETRAEMGIVGSGRAFKQLEFVNR
jgi:predicted dehydrogenase